MNDPGPDFAALAERAFARSAAAFAATLPRIRAGDDPAPVHDVRVAARRLRASLRTFRPLLPNDEQELVRSLRRILRPAGRVRDLDVQLEWLNEWRTKFDLGDDGSMEIIAGLIEHRRAPARLALEKELLQPRTNALVERLDALPSRVREHDPVLAGIPAAVVAPKIIQKVHRRIVRAGDAARQGEPVPEKLHALRITCKRFRYTLEAFDLLYANAAPVLRRTAALQELLGAYQDDEVAARDLQSFATHPSTGVGPSSAFALGRVAELHRTEQRALLLDFPKAYKYVTGSSWRNLRDEMRHERRRVREGGISGFVPRAARDRLGA